MSKLARMKAGAVATVVATSLFMSTVPAFAADQFQTVTVDQIESMSEMEYSNFKTLVAAGDDYSVMNKTIAEYDGLVGDARSDWEAGVDAEAEYEKGHSKWVDSAIDTSDLDKYTSANTAISSDGDVVIDAIKADAAKHPVYYGKYKVPMDDHDESTLSLKGTYGFAREVKTVPVTVYKSNYKNGFVAGYPDGTFKPEAKVTRAEFLAMVSNIIQKNPEYVPHLTKDTYSDILYPYYKIGWWKELYSNNPLLADHVIGLSTVN